MVVTEAKGFVLHSKYRVRMSVTAVAEHLFCVPNNTLTKFRMYGGIPTILHMPLCHVKIKFSLEQATKTQKGSIGITLLFL